MQEVLRESSTERLVQGNIQKIFASPTLYPEREDEICFCICNGMVMGFSPSQRRWIRLLYKPNMPGQ